jgi:hypothetical protein
MEAEGRMGTFREDKGMKIEVAVALVAKSEAKVGEMGARVEAEAPEQVDGRNNGEVSEKAIGGYRCGWACWS